MTDDAVTIPRLPDGCDQVGGTDHAGAPVWFWAGDYVTIRCRCGHLCGIQDHTVDATGRVWPSLACPVDCGSHIFARLEDWDGGARDLGSS
jgi:hypothetical protein